MAKPVCVLSDIEADAWKNEKIAPDCGDHYHIGVTDALDLMDGKHLSSPGAALVGPHHVILINEYTWRVKHSMKLPSGEVVRISTMQFTPVNRR